MMKHLIEILHSEHCSCVIAGSSGTETFFKPGVADLIDLIDTRPDALHDARIADKVVGRAAASLLILGGVSEVYADIMSRSAAAMLEERGAVVSYGQMVETILNRQQTDSCPLEKQCPIGSSPKDNVEAIRSFIAKMRSGAKP